MYLKSDSVKSLTHVPSHFNIGRLAFSLYASYSVTKYGVEAFSDALRREMQPWGIKVSMLEPGAFLTYLCSPDTLERELRQAWNTLSDELKNDYGEDYLNRGINLMVRVWHSLCHNTTLLGERDW